MSLIQSATSQWGWGFHIMGVVSIRGISVFVPGMLGSYRRVGIDPGDLCFRPQVFGVVDVLKDFLCGDGNLSSPGCAGSMYDPQPISDPPVVLGFPHRVGRFRPGGPQVFGVVKVWKDL